jgi:hypothetical protein
MTQTWSCSDSDSCAPAEVPLREKSAIDLLVIHLREQGSDVTWVCSPDRRPCELRVDALLSIDGVAWMVDHMRLTWDEGVVPWMIEAQDYLEPRLDEVAHGVNFRIALQCPRIDSASRKLRLQQLDEVLMWVRQAAVDVQRGALKPLAWRTGPNSLGIQFLPWGETVERPQQPPSIVAFGMARTTNLAEQFHLVNRPVIEGKLKGQLRKGPGRPPMAGLILDQREGEVECFPVANGIFTSGTVTRCLEDLLGETPDRLDAAWFIDSCGSVARVR